MSRLRIPIGVWRLDRAGEVAHYHLPSLGALCGSHVDTIGELYTVAENLGRVALCWGCMLELCPPAKKKKGKRHADR